MSKEVLLSLLQNATTHLNGEIMEITEDINYMENELKITKNKRICDVLKRKYNERKKKKYEELNEIFSQYIKFLLDKRKDCIEDSSPQKLEGELKIKKNLTENINKTNICNEEENETILRDMYQKRDILKNIFHLIKSNNMENLNYENSQRLLSDLILKLKFMDKFTENNCDEITSKDKSKSKTSIIKNDKRINNIDKRILNYLNGNYDLSSEINEHSTAPSASSLVCVSSEKTSDNEENNRSINLKEKDLSKKVKNILLENKKKEKKNHAYFNNKIPFENAKTLEKRNSFYSKHQTKHESLNKFLLNDKLKKNYSGKLLNKFNLTKKSFSNTETKLKVSFLKTKELNKDNLFLIMKNQQINNSSELKGKISIKPNNFLKTCMTSQSSTFNNNSKASFKYLSSLNGSNKNIHNKEINQKKDEKDRKNHSNSSSSFSSSSNFEYKKSRSDSNSSYGRKKYTFKINKNGKGVFSVNKEDKLSKNIYEFEILYDSDFDESASLNSTKDKHKKILHFSFLESGKKIYAIKNLYMTDDEEIKNLHFYNYNCSSIENEYRNNNSKESSNKGKKDMDVLEDTIKNLKDENIRRKYELTKIIDDIKYKNVNINEEGSYNVEFVETNRLRGLYLQMLEKQSELERDKNFYKNELEKLQKDIKNSTLPISEFFKEEKKILLEREKEFYRKEKNYLKKKNELKKTILELQNELDLTQKRLIKEKELNESLNNIIKEHNSILDKNKTEQKNLDKINENKIKMLNDECEKLKEVIVQEKQDKEKLTEEINIHLGEIEKMNEQINLLKNDNTFSNFRKIVLEKVNKTDGDIKYLAQMLELLTKELENKTIKENIINKKIVKMEQNCLKNKKLLNISKRRLKNKKNKMNNMNEEISYLVKKNRNLIKTIKHLKLQNLGLTNIKKKGKEDFIVIDEKKKKKNDTIIHDQTYNNIIKSSDTNGTNIASYMYKNRKEQLNNNQSFTSFSDGSSLLLCTANTKRGYSFEELMNSIDKP
ncbi:conserved Plasmodium protein, unknown function [Plasmodium gallinaceum]|uniref:Uncharacterized protein n=1 Tax=Plasmodium gallinaceum TaxID=5849 RepID=A0A1J1GZG6_PLAGA|nr:conserved Plasmodium protein, unknown function [Plasmodium gallinaceum]CRG96689.1 conserved Plasmodium protein, unknown function [Plasmodium gallinaceum]